MLRLAVRKRSYRNCCQFYQNRWDYGYELEKSLRFAIKRWPWRFEGASGVINTNMQLFKDISVDLDLLWQSDWHVYALFQTVLTELASLRSCPMEDDKPIFFVGTVMSHFISSHEVFILVPARVTTFSFHRDVEHHVYFNTIENISTWTDVNHFLYLGGRPYNTSGNPRRSRLSALYLIGVNLLFLKHLGGCQTCFPTASSL